MTMLIHIYNQTGIINFIMDLCENNTFCMEYDITTSKLFEDEHELYTSNSKKGLVLVCKVGVFFVVKNLQTLLVL